MIFNKNLLVSKGGYMEEIVKTYSLGEIVPIKDVEASLIALNNLLNNSSISKKRLAGRKLYKSLQSQKALEKQFLSMVDNR